MAALRSARVLMFSRPFVVVGLPPFAMARCVATVCHRLRWHVNNFFQNFFPNPTKPQANTHKKLLSHAARCAIVSVRAWIPGRTRAPKRSRLTPRPNARTPTRTRTPVHASAHARTYARTCAHASARPRAQGEGGGSNHHTTTGYPASAPDFFTRTKLEPVTQLLRNGGTPKYPPPR